MHAFLSKELKIVIDILVDQGVAKLWTKAVKITVLINSLRTTWPV